MKINGTFDTKYKEQGLSSQRRYPNESLLRFLSTLPRGGRVLEIGCGSGANLWAIAREGFETYGQDSSEASIALCREMLSSYGVEAQLSVGDFRQLDYPDSFLDAVVDVVSLQHVDLEGHTMALSEIRRILKPSGQFFSWHLGSHSVSFEQSGGRGVDRNTVDNIANQDVPLHDNGLTCFLDVETTQKLLSHFKDVSIEITTRTYRNRTQSMEYLAITARK
jgi:ubiquinone/menaquinone biosynthesis C-methylase UbiE